MYLYRAVDSQGNTLEFLLSPTRDAQAAKRFFAKAPAAPHTSTPRVSTVDKNAAYPKAFKELKAERIMPDACELRQSKYLNNLVEQDHSVHTTAGTGKLRTPAGMEHGLKESLNRAWSYLKAVQDRLGLAPTLAQKDVVAEAIDLSGGHVECTCGVAFLVAMLSALGQKRVQAGTLVLGDLTIQGNIKALPSITEILQMALENGALRALLPTGNKVQFSGLPEEVVEKIDIIFYSDVDRAITKAVEV